MNNILAWAYCWHHMQPKDPREHAKKKIWETAAARHLVHGKTASELQAKFRQLARKFGGIDKAIEEGRHYVGGQTWLEEFYTTGWKWTLTSSFVIFCATLYFSSRNWAIARSCEILQTSRLIGYWKESLMCEEEMFWKMISLPELIASLQEASSVNASQ